MAIILIPTLNTTSETHTPTDDTQIGIIGEELWNTAYVRCLFFADFHDLSRLVIRENESLEADEI